MGRSKKSGRKRKLGYAEQETTSNGKTVQTSYKFSEKKNELFVKYYKGQNLVPEGEWTEFEESLRSELPVTFRITGSRGQAKQLLEIIKGQYFNSIVNQTMDDGTEIQPPKVLPWYPDELAWHIDMSRRFIRNNASMRKLHEFLIAETESGNISRQEAVSMIPPLLLEIKPHHKILDLCAAPGSKTAQLIEYLHADETQPLPEGYVLASDKDNKRCYLMVHQVKRLQSPNFMIINQDATVFPKIRISPEDQKPEFVMFDRILADVPCTGDGTMRKNPDVWGKWKPYNGPGLHSLQLKILKRGLELLAEGGRLVYSTCSFNPIEDEAVVAELLRQCKGSVELVDIQEQLTDLKFVPGLSTWRCMLSSGEWVDLYENVPKGISGVFRSSMFPPSQEEAEWMKLNKCMRILPHHQNTGGFFICALTKTTNLPWFKPKKQLVESEKTDDSIEGTDTPPSETVAEEENKTPKTEWRPPKKRQKIYGYKEDPFFFMKRTDTVWPIIKDFYTVPDEFPVEQIMFRSELGNKKNLYFVSSHIKNIVECNVDRLRFINMGIKLFSRNPSPLVPDCDFRLNHECLASLYKFFPGRYMQITKEDAVLLLSEETPFSIKFDKSSQARIEELTPGSVIFHYKPTEKDSFPKCEILFCGWRGKVSLRSFVSNHDRQHYLLLCGMDLQAIRDKVNADKEKKKKEEEAKKEAAKTDEAKKDEEKMEEAKSEEATSEEATSAEAKKDEDSSVLEAGGGEGDVKDQPMDDSVEEQKKERVEDETKSESVVTDEDIKS